ncbi:PepSY-associated TM helix domain-containing protein [Alkalilimnicola sp. S0819]|uniref:PepSY-associated TM helix domain-containing protein n=1 Tax=Alkalilimnicola sp. S0819 TaxID=2613922 RepID=UPI0012622B3E|nr:PepSY-associated TM helix domain-containing protein [Alkalilimnicola sp. S0819]KAB7624201.1 PepSY domain-containing protein [Alkalilimnicola sp. S0819]MPQ16456.1 PepSY domain-containing protein [Alkalilimnicola sp. S0819]
MRRLLTLLHTYLGLIAGLLLALTGLTGSLLVFDHALDERLAPHTLAQAEGAPAPLQAVLDAARNAAPGHPPPTRLHLARRPGSAHVVRFPTPEGAVGPLEITVDPVSAQVLAVRGWGEYPMSWLYRLHYTLLAGQTGKYLVGVGGILLLFFCLSGAYLWWPRPGRWWRALTVKWRSGAFRLNYDLHKISGIYLLPVLGVVAFSGVSLVFPRPMMSLVAPLSAPEPFPSPSSTPVPSPERLDADRAVAVAEAVFPAGNLKRIYLPRRPEDTYRLSYRLPGEPWSAHGASYVWVDQYSGEVLGSRDATRVSGGSQFMNWQFPLHNGDALGLAGRWLVFASGLMPALLFGTGFYMWWRKRQGRRRGRTRQHAEQTG